VRYLTYMYAYTHLLCHVGIVLSCHLSSDATVFNFYIRYSDKNIYGNDIL